MNKPPGGARTVRIWLLLASISVPIFWPVLVKGEPWRVAIPWSGWAAALLLCTALAIAPLRIWKPRFAATAWLLRHRRAIGLAAFFHAMLHMIATGMAVGRLDYLVQGLAFASMWTGWLALAMLVPVALASNDRAARRLGCYWKPIQRLAWPAAVLALLHMILLAPPLWAASLAAALAAIQVLRLFRRHEAQE